MIKKTVLSVLVYFILIFVAQSQVIFNIDVNKKGIQISPTHYGIFFEDINHAADGGLYAELIRNRSFEDAATPDYWTSVNQGDSRSIVALETSDLLNSVQTRALKLSILKASNDAKAGIYNSGYWGINIVNGREYTLTFFAKCDAAFTGTIIASLENTNGTVSYAQTNITGLTNVWKKYTCTLTASGSDSNGRFSLTANGIGTIWFDVVSLFPPTYKNRPNGCRADLAQLLADLQPKFMRFPGGCFVEGDYLANRFQWKNSVGNIENRCGHSNLWGYRTSDGMGFHEFLQLSEDIGAKPLYVVNVGLAHNDNQPYTSLNDYIQDAMDALEYANGETTSTYGALRAANGHPQPFNIEYVEIGNENYFGDNYGNRYIQFYNAIKAKYPTINCIGNVAAWGTDTPSWTFTHPVDLVDEHYYRDPYWFINQYNKYDSYNRNGSKVYVGEYAVTSGCGNGNLIAALGEAVYMCGMEKNSDVVTMNSYAPIFVNASDRNWNPDMIVYNSSSVYCTPSYYVQKMFSNNVGNVTVAVKDSLNQYATPIEGIGNVGLGTWATQADFTSIKVTDSKGNDVVSEPFSTASNWNAGTGTWSLNNTIYSQTSSSTDCRSIQQTQITDSTYTYTLKARKTGGNEGFLIIFGYKDSNNFYWWNIGGWGNSKHAIEHCVNGTKSTVASVNGSISSNVWYDIRIEVSSSKILCYLNNQLIHTLSMTVTPKLFTSATLDEVKKQLIIKVVNPNKFNVNSSFYFKNLQGANANIEKIVMSSLNNQTENSFDNATNVVPQTSTIVTKNDTLVTDFNANSVNILKLDLSSLQSNPNVKLSENKLKISPNPTNKSIQVTWSENTIVSVNVKDLKGRSVLNKRVKGKESVDISEILPGVYILSARNDKGKLESAKFIIQ